MKILTILLSAALPLAAAPAAPSWSGVYPHLAFFNEEGECGTGAVVQWADRLWVITYGPHLPFGSTDKLYEITPDLQQVIRPESVGGTPANRMIHRESNQLIIGPYFIDAERNVRVVPPKLMPGRHTGNARHLTDPAGKVYFATMEEGLYEVDVKSLEVTGLIKDGNPAKPGQTAEKNPAKISSQLPGYHGKGLYSGQGRVVYANNGDRAKEALVDPRTASGALGEWTGEGDWKLVRRNQFTEVTGPGGIEGAKDPAKDPIWSMGWDSRSLILMLLDGGVWKSFRLPKASHCYDGAHGWNTEWPRIREIGEEDLLGTMHGTFWRFPETFSAANTAGIRPRSTYLRVIGDFCRWKDRLVFGCDDTAKSAFLNAKDGGDLLMGPGQSQSNLWFASPSVFADLGPAIGRGSLWRNENVKSGAVSDPFLFAGYARRCLHLSHKSASEVPLVLEIDAKGDGSWVKLEEIKLPASSSKRIDFPQNAKGEWIRIRCGADAVALHASFVYSAKETRGTRPDAMFETLADVGEAGESSSGWVRARGNNRRSLLVSASSAAGAKPDGSACYELDASMKLVPLKEAPAAHELKLGTRPPHGSVSVEAASVVFTDERGVRWRIPRGPDGFDALTQSGALRVQREVSTERYLFNCHGTFYELPTENAGGFAKIRPVSSHRKVIGDFASYRGLLVMTGIPASAKGERVIRSEDGKAAVWLGGIDDLWKLGKPTGRGGPWLDTAVSAGQASDPYLFTGYDAKSMTLSHDGSSPVVMRVELDATGEGDWMLYQEFNVEPGKALKHEFPEGCQAYWLRVTSSAAVKATAQLDYR